MGMEKLWPIACILGSTALYGQDSGEIVNQEEPALPATPQAEPAPAEGQPENREVVGSRIKRTDAETTAPITIIDREEIENSGVISIGELFKKSATSSPIGTFTGESGYLCCRNIYDQSSGTWCIKNLGSIEWKTATQCSRH